MCLLKVLTVFTNGFVEITVQSRCSDVSEPEFVRVQLELLKLYIQYVFPFLQVLRFLFQSFRSLGNSGLLCTASLKI